MGVNGGWSRGRFDVGVKSVSGKSPIAAAFADGDMCLSKFSAVTALGLLGDGLGVGVFGENMARPLIIFWIFQEKNKKKEER